MNSRSVVDTIATQAASEKQASVAALAIFEARVIASLAMGTRDEWVDFKLYELEMAYHRRADELKRKREAGRRKK